MKVIYPVLFYEEKDGKYSVFVPDLNNASTYGNTLEDAINMTEDLIFGLVLDSIEEEEKIPNASKIENVSFEKLEEYLEIENWDYVSKFKTYVSVDFGNITEKNGKELVKKTVNIPKWINVRAERLKINFSKTLEEALLQRIYSEKRGH